MRPLIPTDFPTSCWTLRSLSTPVATQMAIADYSRHGKIRSSRNFSMTKPKIVAYLKPSCGWSQGVRAIMRKYDLPFEDRDIINDPAQRQEMIEKSGQMLSPCVEINGKMLP